MAKKPRILLAYQIPYEKQHRLIMRFWGFIAVLTLLVMVLMWQFPYMAGNTDQFMNVLYLVFLIALIGSGGTFSRMPASETTKNALLWIGIILLVALGYSFRADIKGTRLYGALVPSTVQITSEGSLRINRAEDGHFHIEAELNGSPESFLVDTGASDIVLSARAATAAGYDPDTLNYSRSYNTANGVVRGAPIKLDTLLVGSVLLKNIPASVNQGELDESLLGMAFLNQFKSFHVEDNTLTLYP